MQAPAELPRHSRLRRAITSAAKMISAVCNPFVTPLALFILLTAASAPSPPVFWWRLFVAIFFTTLGPLVFLFWLYATERISDLDMSDRAERERVFGAFVMFYIAGTAALFAIRAPIMISASMAGYAASALVVQYITRSWKISTHALGITAPLVALVFLYGEEPLPFLLLIPLVGWSRVYLKAHTVLQVVAGTLLGAFSVWLFFTLFRVPMAL
jgi:membrane-associated phospholipid phosphatase